MGILLPMVDTWHCLLDFLDLVSMSCRLRVDETSGMQKDRYWEYLISGKFLQMLPGKVSNCSCPEYSGTPILLSHLDNLIGTLQLL